MKLIEDDEELWLQFFKLEMIHAAPMPTIEGEKEKKTEEEKTPQEIYKIPMLIYDRVSKCKCSLELVDTWV